MKNPPSMVGFTASPFWLFWLWPGLCILTTNARDAIDSAFFRRFRFMVETLGAKIWRWRLLEMFGWEKQWEKWYKLVVQSLLIHFVQHSNGYLCGFLSVFMCDVQWTHWSMLQRLMDSTSPLIKVIKQLYRSLLWCQPWSNTHWLSILGLPPNCDRSW